MPVPVLISRGWPLLALAGLVSWRPTPMRSGSRQGQGEGGCAAAAHDRRREAPSDALLLVANADPKGSNEATRWRTWKTFSTTA